VSKTFTIEHEIAADEDTFWKVFFDADYMVALYAKALAFPKYELLKFEETDATIVRSIRVTPKLDLPGPIAKLLGPGFAYNEEGTFDRKKKVWTWRTTPSDKMRSEGTLHTEPLGAGRVRRVGKFDIEGKMFGIGGLLESTLEKNLRSGWDKSAAFMNRWVAGARE